MPKRTRTTNSLEQKQANLPEQKQANSPKRRCVNLADCLTPKSPITQLCTGCAHEECGCTGIEGSFLHSRCQILLEYIVIIIQLVDQLCSLLSGDNQRLLLVLRQSMIVPHKHDRVSIMSWSVEQLWSFLNSLDDRNLANDATKMVDVIYKVLNKFDDPLGLRDTSDEDTNDE